MKTLTSLRLTMFVAVVLFAAVATAQDDGGVFNRDYNVGGGGGSGCSTCYVSQSGYTISMYCGSPSSGEMGHQYCRVETYPEGSYCFVDGDACCID
jgi:hypothetical protein